MNKARKKAYRPATAKRLLSESFVLSCTRFASSRVVRFFEKGIASPVVSSVKKIDGLVQEKLTRPLFKKTELHKSVIKPSRNAVASALTNNRATEYLNGLRNAVLSTPLRSVGVFMLIFGIYAAAIFFLKRYVSFSIGTADTDDLCVSALMFIVGLLFSTFGDKSIGHSIGNSRLIGTLLTESLGVNDSSLSRLPKKNSKNAVGISFLLGSLLGVMSLFFSPAKIILTALLLILLCAVINIPELGLLMTVGTVSFVNVKITALLSITAFLSYTFKYLRLKRNLRFGTSDAAMLLFTIVLLFSCLFTGGGLSSGELYLISFVSLYFLTRNLICSKRLIIQTFNALSVGLMLGILLYLLNSYSAFIPHADLRAAVSLITAHTLSADMLALVTAVTVPFMLSMFSTPLGKRSKLFSLLLVMICLLVTDSLLFYALTFASVFVYIASAYKAPVGALISGLVFMIPTLTLLSDYTVSKAVAAFKYTLCDRLFGIDGFGAYSLWDSLAGVGGVVAVILFLVAILLVLQRAFCTPVKTKSEACAVYSGTVLASSITAFAVSLIFNPFSDLRVTALMWFVWGLGGAVYHVCAKVDTTEEV